MPKRISHADPTPIRVVIVTLDNHLSGALDRVRRDLKTVLPGLSLELHAASKWGSDPQALEECKAAIASGDIIVATMLFMEDHVQAIMPALEARRDSCDAMMCGMSAGEVIKLTRMGRFSMGDSQSGAMGLLKQLRGKRKGNGSSGHGQMAMLRRLPKILKFIPGTAQDVRAYFMTMLYWMSASDENLSNLVRFLVSRYAAGPREQLKQIVKAGPPAEYPDVGLYHPHMAGRISDDVSTLPAPPTKAGRGTVGLLIMRAYVLAGDTGHYDGMIAALEARGLKVVPAFASGLDARPAVEKFFRKDGKTTVDAIVSLTGFSLVGGPAYNDSRAAEDMLSDLDVPYLAAHALEFQTLDQWQQCERGLLPVEATMMVAIPELDGSTGPIVYGGRSSEGGQKEMTVCTDRAEMLAARVERLVALRQTPRADRKIATVLFNFPPNSGGTGTAANLSVFASLYNTLKGLKDEGYTVDLPADVDALRQRIIGGNAAQHGMDANVAARIATDDYVRREPWLDEIEAQWGPAPGRQQSDGAGLFVLGAHFGNVFVGVQPAFGYEGDPMRLLFEKGFTPTHAFSAFYHFLKHDFKADAVLHFGTHGALEFMPGKQVGLSKDCWPDRLIGDLPNFYLYAANNPSEGMIAKRRAAATLISYLTPPVGNAGLYRGLSDLKASIDRWRGLPPDAAAERERLAELIQTQAAELDLAEIKPHWNGSSEGHIKRLTDNLLELEQTLIPHGLHVVGSTPSAEERTDLLKASAEASGNDVPQASIEALVAGRPVKQALQAGELKQTEETLAALQTLEQTNRLLMEEHEIPGIIGALDGRFVRPAPGGDLIRTPDILPTGRNIHGFDPFRLPSAFAVADGARQADLIIARHLEEGADIPESVALVLWGTDNLKNEGTPIGQALALIGAKPRFDSFGRLCGAELLPLEELTRPRIDVLMTLSGIFRDLLPLQTRLLAEASFLAATAEEPAERNFIRKHALEYLQTHDCDMETAALRVFSNAEGAYGSNVNQLIDSGSWDDEDELATAYTARKCFAYGRSGRPVRQSELLENALGKVELAYQNLESVELGVTTIDHYFDTLGGIGRAVRRAKGDAVPVYIGDQTRGQDKVRTLSEQVALETRTRALNPKWYEGMLEHGYEGVRQIEAQVTNTMGWSATTGQVAPWVYQKLTQTFVLDDAMRRRLADLNPKASATLANRLIEAHERNYWSSDEETLEALRRAGEELEDRLEGVHTAIPAG